MGYFNNGNLQPQKVTWANPQIVPESQRQSGGWYFNPQSGYVERWWDDNDGPGFSGGDPVDDYLNQITSTLTSIVNPTFSEVDKYLQDNPFAYDDAWLDATEKQVREEVDMEPYFKEKLSNYIDDVKTQKERANEDETTLLKELDRQENVYLKEDTLSYQKARENALEGVSGAGLVGQGAGMREVNRGDISHQTGLNDYLDRQDLRKQQAQTTTSRLLSDLETGQKRFETELGREKELYTQSEIQNRKQDKYNYWEAGLKTAQSGLGGYI